MRAVGGGGAADGGPGYLSCVTLALDTQVKEWLFLPSVTSMAAVLMVTPTPSGW